MSAQPDFVMSTFIACDRDALWHALTDPATMARYHFMARKVDKDGDAYVYRHDDGRPLLTTRVLKVEPKTRIEATFEPHWEEVAPSRQVFLIAVEGAYCRLTIEHYGLTHAVVPGQGVADGWARWAAGLKTFLECGQTPRFIEAAAAG